MTFMEKPKRATATGQSKSSPAVTILIILVVMFASTSVYLYTQLRAGQKPSEVAAQEETAKLVERVGQLIVLPQDETPTIATVNDPEVLREQAFFAKASVGDKVLIYTNARKAILYNPATHKIIDVAPLNIGTPDTSAPQE